MRCLAILWIAVAAAISAGSSNADEQPPAGKSPAVAGQFRETLAPAHQAGAAPAGRLAGGTQGGGPVLLAVRPRPANPRGPGGGTIYVQPLGDFDPAQRKVLDRTAEFLGIYFQLPVKVRDDLSLDVIPASARREHPTWHVRQILSTHVLDKFLRPRLPADACAYIALTTSD